MCAGLLKGCGLFKIHTQSKKKKRCNLDLRLAFLTLKAAFISLQISVLPRHLSFTAGLSPGATSLPEPSPSPRQYFYANSLSSPAGIPGLQTKFHTLPSSSLRSHLCPWVL